jgi:hypothetical protein
MASEVFAGAVSAASAAAARLKDHPIPSATAQNIGAEKRLSLVFIKIESERELLF